MYIMLGIHYLIECICNVVLLTVTLKHKVLFCFMPYSWLQNGHDCGYVLQMEIH